MATVPVATPARAGHNKQYSNDVAIFFWGGKTGAHVKAISGFKARASVRGSEFKGFLAANAEFDAARACHQKLAGFWNQESRVYLVGHGDWELCTLAGHSPDKIALFLRAAQMPRVKTVSVVACDLGRDAKWKPGTALAQHCETSFGGQLYKHIHIYCDKLAVRTLNTAVHPRTGQKYTRLNKAENWQNHQDETKIVFSAGGYQVISPWLDQLDDIIDEINDMIK